MNVTFDHTPDYVRFVVHNVVFWQVFLTALHFYPLNVIPLMLHSHVFFIYRRKDETEAIDSVAEWNTSLSTSLYVNKSTTPTDTAVNIRVH